MRRAALFFVLVVTGLLAAASLALEWIARREALPSLGDADARATVAEQAAWLGVGEQLGSGVERLQGWELFQNPKPPGTIAAVIVAASVVSSTPDPRPIRSRHLRILAVSRWLSRHANEVQLQRLLARHAYFGRDSQGMESASLAYFGRPLTELTTVEAVTLGALANTDDTMDPACAEPRATARRTALLGQLGLGTLAGEPVTVLPAGRGCGRYVVIP